MLCCSYPYRRCIAMPSSCGCVLAREHCRNVVWRVLEATEECLIETLPCEAALRGSITAVIA